MILALALLLQDDPRELLERLRSEDVEVRESAARALVKLGAAALPALDEAASGADPELRARARRAGGLIRFGELGGGAPWTFPRWRETVGEALAREAPERWSRLRELGVRLSDEDFRAAEKGVEGLKPRWRAVVARWIERDPRAAADWSRAQLAHVRSEGDEVLRFLAAVVEGWARRDAAAARAWAEALEAGPVRDELLRRLAR